MLRQVEALFEALGGGVSAVVGLECEGSRYGEGVGGWLVGRRIPEWRCGGYDRNHDCIPERKTSDGSTDTLNVARGTGRLACMLAV